MAKHGIVLVSHVPEIAEGLTALLKEIAKDVSITFAGGTDEGEIGSSFDKISEAVANNEADEILAFYDLGSAKMTLDMVMELSDKKIHLLDAAMVEGAYTAATLAQGNTSLEDILNQIELLIVK